MFFPIIVQYLDAIQQGAGSFDKLAGIVIERDEKGNPVFISGCNTVIFRVSWQGKRYGLKCFTSRIDGIVETYKRLEEFCKENDFPFAARAMVFDEEIRVVGFNGEVRRFPVVLSEWVEGRSLASLIRQYTYLNEPERIRQLRERFVELSLQLLALDMAHGDIKPDNIIVTESGEIKLIDFDAAYLPGLVRKESGEIGTPWFQHPLREMQHYDRTLDDYSIALITVSLLALEQLPSLYDSYSNDENLIFSPDRISKGIDVPFNILKKRWAYQPIYLRLLMTLDIRNHTLKNRSDGLPDISISNLKRLLEHLSQRRAIDLNDYTLLPEDEGREIRRVISRSGLYGYINQENILIVDCMYGDATPFHNGYGSVRLNADCFYIDEEGEIVSPVFEAIGSEGDGLVAIRNEGMWGYVYLSDFSLALPFCYEYAGPFSEGKAVVMQEGTYYYIDINGESLFGDTRFDFAHDFRNGYAIVREGTLYRVIDEKGDTVIRSDRDTFLRTDGNSLTFRRDDKRIETTLSNYKKEYEEA